MTVQRLLGFFFLSSKDDSMFSLSLLRVFKTLVVIKSLHPRSQRGKKFEKENFDDLSREYGWDDNFSIAIHLKKMVLWKGKIGF